MILRRIFALPTNISRKTPRLHPIASKGHPTEVSYPTPPYGTGDVNWHTVRDFDPNDIPRQTTEDTITTKSHLNSFSSGKDLRHLPEPGDQQNSINKFTTFTQTSSTVFILPRLNTKRSPIPLPAPRYTTITTRPPTTQRIQLESTKRGTPTNSDPTTLAQGFPNEPYTYWNSVDLTVTNIKLANDSTAGRNI